MIGKLQRINLLVALFVLVCLAGCGGDDGFPTRTPVPTWTPTAVGGAPAVVAPVGQQPEGQENQPLPQPATDTPAPAPVPTDTPQPTPLPADTATPEPTATETATAEPSPTATPAFSFELETAEKLATQTLSANMVRVFLYVYSPAELGLAGYKVRVKHNDIELAVNDLSTAGLPKQTRTAPGPDTRFTNLNVVFVETQAGRWEVQLVDDSGTPTGPAAIFDLTADEVTRELYVRYKQK